MKGLAARYAPKIALSLVIAAALLYVLKRGGLPVVPAAEAFSHVRWWTAPAYFLMQTVASYFRGVRWRFLLRPIAPVSGRRAVTAVLIGSAAVLLLPFRLGEMVRAYLVGRDKRIGLV